jgi:hypothetical protein
MNFDSGVDPQPESRHADISAIREAARELLNRNGGLNPIPIEPRADGAPSKGPNIPEWQKKKMNLDEVDFKFTAGYNLGAQFLGDLVDTDLDCPEAVALARYILPHTACRFGRRSKGYAHLVYNVPTYKGDRQAFVDIKQNPHDKNEKDQMLLEIRHGACQTVMPPSVYPDGEIAERAPNFSWDATTLSAKEYVQSVKRLAAATLIVRHLGEGKRHDFWLYLSGAMARSGWSRDAAQGFCHTVCLVMCDRESRQTQIDNSFDKHEKKEPVAGLDKLDEIVGSAVTNKLVKWLEL